MNDNDAIKVFYKGKRVLSSLLNRRLPQRALLLFAAGVIMPASVLHIPLRHLGFQGMFRKEGKDISLLFDRRILSPAQADGLEIFPWDLLQKDL